MRLTVDEQADREVGRPLYVNHVSLALRRLGLARVCEGDGIGTERGGKHPKREPHEVLLDAIDPRFAYGILLCGGRSGRSLASGGRRRRRRLLNEVAGIEADRRRSAFLRGDLILPDVFVRQLADDFELDRDEIVAADLPGAASRHEAPDRRQTRLAAERLARRRHDARRIR
jgi:hypothetical protein